MDIEKIRKLALSKRQILEQNGEDLSKVNNVLSFLKDDMCFFKVDINLSIPILLYLGVKEEEVKDVYFQLISANNFKREYDVRKIISK